MSLTFSEERCGKTFVYVCVDHPLLSGFDDFGADRASHGFFSHDYRWNRTICPSITQGDLPKGERGAEGERKERKASPMGLRKEGSLPLSEFLCVRVCNFEFSDKYEARTNTKLPSRKNTGNPMPANGGFPPPAFTAVSAEALGSLCVLSSFAVHRTKLKHLPFVPKRVSHQFFPFAFSLGSAKSWLRHVLSHNSGFRGLAGRVLEQHAGIDFLASHLCQRPGS